MASIIRPAVRGDVPEIQAIYNHAVLHTTAAYDEDVQPVRVRYDWFDDHQRRNMPIYAAESGGRIVGWSALGPFRPRPGYRFTAEDSIYIAEEWRGQGLGAALLQPLIDDAARLKLRTILAVIGDAANTGSIRLHEKFGFERVALLRSVGFKFGRWLDQVWLQRMVP
jgi:L-amino acid N-acyltransferase